MAYGAGGDFMIKFASNYQQLISDLRAQATSLSNEEFLLKFGINASDIDSLFERITSFKVAVNEATQETQLLGATWRNVNGGATTYSGGFVTSMDNMRQHMQQLTSTSRELVSVQNQMTKSFSNGTYKKSGEDMNWLKERAESLTQQFQKLSIEANMAGESYAKNAARVGYNVQDSQLATTYAEAQQNVRAFNQEQSQVLALQKQILSLTQQIRNNPMANTAEIQKYISMLQQEVTSHQQVADSYMQELQIMKESAQQKIAEEQRIVDGIKAGDEQIIAEAMKVAEVEIEQQRRVTQAKIQADEQELANKKASLQQELGAYAEVAIQYTNMYGAEAAIKGSGFSESVQEDLRNVELLSAGIARNNMNLQQMNTEVKTGTAALRVHEQALASAKQGYAGVVTQENAAKTSAAQLNKELMLYRGQVSSTARVQKNFFREIASGWKEATARIINYTVIYGGIYAIWNSLRDAVDTVKQLNDAFTNLQMVTGYTNDQMRELRSTYADFAKELGSSIDQVAQGAETWLRAGKSVEDTNKLLKVSTILSKISGMEAEDASEKLIA